MKAVTENTTKSFEPVAVEGTDITIDFNDSIRDGVRRISGTPKKNGASLGLLTYRADDKSFTLSLKPIEGRNLRKLGDILATMADCVNEILGEDSEKEEEEV